MVDLLLLGATGFTGHLIARYLSTHRQRDSFTFAIAGRSKAKLEALKKQLELGDDVEIVQVDVTNDEEVNSAVKKARVVLSTVGPYWRWGTPVVRACAEHGVHYVDITGETHWVNDVIKSFDWLAFKRRAALVPSCGFDSLPSDLAVHLSARTLRAALGPQPGLGASFTEHTVRGGVSGGTLATVLAEVEEVPSKKMREVRSVYSLSPVPSGPSSSLAKLLYSIPALPGQARSWGCWWPLAMHNREVVFRSWGLLQARLWSAPARRSAAGATEGDAAGEDSQTGEDAAAGVGEEDAPPPYGPTFTYEEFARTRGPLSALFWSGLFISALVLIAVFPPARWLLRRLAPAPGEGPDEKSLETGFLNTRNVTFAAPSPAPAPAPSSSAKGKGKAPAPLAAVETIIKGRGDPGYTLTAIMAAETALALLEPASLTPLARRGGVLTPATAAGDALARRLVESGRFEITSRLVC